MFPKLCEAVKDAPVVDRNGEKIRIGSTVRSDVTTKTVTRFCGSQVWGTSDDGISESWCYGDECEVVSQRSAAPVAAPECEACGGLVDRPTGGLSGNWAPDVHGAQVCSCVWTCEQKVLEDRIRARRSAKAGQTIPAPPPFFGVYVAAFMLAKPERVPRAA
jgi:hypothetical protein